MNEEYSPRGNLYSLTTVWSVVYLFQGEGYSVGCCLGLSQSVCLGTLEHSKGNVFTWAVVQT